MDVSEQQPAIERALTTWVSMHPRPDTPAIVMMGRSYSPRQLLSEVRTRTDLGERFVSYLVAAAARQDATPAELIARMVEQGRKYGGGHGAARDGGEP